MSSSKLAGTSMTGSPDPFTIPRGRSNSTAWLGSKGPILIQSLYEAEKAGVKWARQGGMARIFPRSPVVSRPRGRRGGRGARVARALACAAAFVTAVAPPSARADEDDEEAEEPDAAAALDGLASPGPILRAGPLRPEMSAFPLRACSFQKPLCVSAPRTASPADVLATLASAERAWDIATGALDLPAPDADLGTGADDIYLAGRGARTALSIRDVRSRIDRASAFTTLDPRLRGCSRDRAVAEELFRAILFRVAPAIDEGSARAQSGALASLVAPCAAVDTS